MVGKKKKAGGAKTMRSEVVTVRLDPQLRYLAEVAARAQRMTLSSYVERVIEESLVNVLVLTDKAAVPLAQIASQLWDPDEADRFAKMAIRFPHLLNFEEQILWKLIRETVWRRSVWTPRYQAGEASTIPVEDLQLLRRYWEQLKAAVGDDSARESVYVLFNNGPRESPVKETDGEKPKEKEDGQDL